MRLNELRLKIFINLKLVVFLIKKNLVILVKIVCTVKNLIKKIINVYQKLYFKLEVKIYVENVHRMMFVYQEITILYKIKIFY